MLEVHLSPPISEWPGCLPTTKRTGQIMTPIKIKLLQLNQAADWIERAYQKRRANENRRGLCPYTLTSTKRTSKLLAKSEIQICQLIQILKCLKIAWIDQSVSSVVAPAQFSGSN